jgi:hypothetical protein
VLLSRVVTIEREVEVCIYDTQSHSRTTVTCASEQCHILNRHENNEEMYNDFSNQQESNLRNETRTLTQTTKQKSRMLIIA